jgi:DNA-binding transcriptional LysR family regulator
MVMTPIVVQFLRRYPDMKVDIVTEGRLIDIVAEGFDAGIRQSAEVPQDMIAVPCSPPIRFAVVG